MSTGTEREIFLATRPALHWPNCSKIYFIIDERLFPFSGVSAAGILYAISATPIYSVDTLIQVQENKHSALGSLSEISNALDIQNSAVVGEIDIARSRTVVTQAIEATAAQAEVSVSNRVPLVAGLLEPILSKDANGLVIPLFNTRSGRGAVNESNSPGSTSRMHSLAKAGVRLSRRRPVRVEGQRWSGGVEGRNRHAERR